MPSVTPSPAVMYLHTRVGQVLPCSIPRGGESELNYNGQYVQFRLPEDGMQIDYDLKVITHNSRDGTLYGARRGLAVKSLSVTIPALSPLVFSEIERFILTYRGKVVVFKDAYQTPHNVIVTSFSAVEQGFNRGYTITLQMKVK